MRRRDRIEMSVAGVLCLFGGVVAIVALGTVLVDDPNEVESVGGVIGVFLAAILTAGGIGLLATAITGEREPVDKRDMRKSTPRKKRSRVPRWEQRRNARDLLVFAAGVAAGIERYDMKLRDEADNIKLFKLLVADSKDGVNQYLRVGEVDLLYNRTDSANEAKELATRWLGERNADLGKARHHRWDDEL